MKNNLSELKRYNLTTTVVILVFVLLTCAVLHGFFSLTAWLLSLVFSVTVDAWHVFVGCVCLIIGVGLIEGARR